MSNEVIKKQSKTVRKKSNAGRKIFDGRDEKEVRDKLKHAFSVGCNNREAILYAEINHFMFYAYLNRYPDFRDEIERIKEKPVLKARITIYNDLSSVDTAKWYLTKKRPKEFGDKIIQDVNVKDKRIILD